MSKKQMTRDEFRTHYYDGNKIFIRISDGKLFKVLNIDNTTHVVFYTKCTSKAHSRTRALDITSFAKQFTTPARA